MNAKNIGIKLGQIFTYVHRCSCFRYKSACMGCKGSWVQIPPPRPTFFNQNKSLPQSRIAHDDSCKHPVFNLFSCVLTVKLGQIWERLLDRLCCPGQRSLSRALQATARLLSLVHKRNQLQELSGSSRLHVQKFQQGLTIGG